MSKEALHAHVDREARNEVREAWVVLHCWRSMAEHLQSHCNVKAVGKNLLVALDEGGQVVQACQVLRPELPVHS